MHAKRGKLVAARARYNWTLSQAAERIGCAPNTVSRWELGTLAPSAYYRERLSIVYEMSAEQLGLVEEMPSFSAPAMQNMPQTYIHANLTMRLLSLIASPTITHNEVQQELEQALETFIHTNPDQKQKLWDALHIVAMYPVTSNSNGSILRSVEIVLNHYAAGILACGYLSNGSFEDIQLASTMITYYLPILHAIYTESPRYRKATAELISQALQIKSRSEEIDQAISDKEQAVHYARQSGNRITLVTALRALTTHYEFGITDNPERAQKAFQLAEEAQYLMEQKHGQAVLVCHTSFATVSGSEQGSLS